MINADACGPLWPTLGRLLSEPLEPTEAGQLLQELAGAAGYRAAGLRWPVEAPARFAVPAGDADDLPAAAVEALRGGRTAEVRGRHDRLYALMPAAGRRPGAVFLQREAGAAWSDSDRALAAFLGGLLGRSAFLERRQELGIDQRRLVTRLRDSSVIAGRIAHDFDNILTGILGFADLTAGLLPAGSPAQGYVQEITKVGQRGVGFTDQLHQLSRSGQTKPRPGSVAAVLAEEVRRLTPRLGPGVTLRPDVPQGLPPVGMEHEPLRAVLGHVLDNAVEACEKSGGAVTVSARATEFGPAEAEGFLGNLKPGPAVEVTVRDTGGGMTPEAYARLFVEPFHTTKVRHRGLGLAIAYRILHSHEGGILIENDQGHGTAVHIALPHSRY